MILEETHACARSSTRSGWHAVSPLGFEEVDEGRWPAAQNAPNSFRLSTIQRSGVSDHHLGGNPDHRMIGVQRSKLRVQAPLHSRHVCNGDAEVVPPAL